MSRREAIGLFASVPLALTLGCTPAGSDRASRAAQQTTALRAAGAGFQPKFFTPHEYETVRVLVDLVIPRDERSGSATDARVPEFMDFMMSDQDTPAEARTAMRGGLAWIDAECRRRHGRPFVECAGAERTTLLDDIAWPARARPDLSHGAAFFTAFRDLTASGFWSSEIGVKDLQYRGNAFVPEWTGCPDAALRKVGVRYD
ncbi:MAG: gluconate 2-dehydrogenase subunit 3 family protein, partial [Gemmatimonadales bacterium]